MATLSIGTVSTDRPARYAKQLVNHMSRRYGGQWSTETESGWIDLMAGWVTAECVDGVLTLAVDSPNEETSGRLEHVLDIHLVRFAGEGQISTAWVRTES